MIDASHDGRSLEEISDLYRSLFDLSPLPTIVYGAGGLVLRINEAGAAAFGFASVDDAIGTNVIERIHPDSRPLVIERMGRMMAGGEPLPPAEERFVRVDGSEFLGETVAAPIVWHGERAVHVIVRDVTDIRAAQVALHESGERYRELFELSPEPMVVHDGAVIIQANQAAAAWFGGDLASVTGVRIWDHLLSPAPEVLVERIRQMIATGRSASAIQVRMAAVDGSPLEAELISAPTSWNGQHVIISVFHDLTERMRASEALAQAELRFRSIFENAPLGIHVFHLESDGKLHFIESNAAAERILGVSAVGAYGLPFEEAFPGLADTDVPTRYAEAARDGQTLGRHLVSYDDGVIKGSFEVTAFPSGPGFLTVMFTDETDRLAAEAELDRYRHNLEVLVDERTRELKQAQRDVGAIATIAARAVELRDPYTAGHQRRVAQLVTAIARQLELSEETAERVRVAAQLHDIGKLSIPAEILSRPGALLPIEYELVKGHAWAAHDILTEVDMEWPLAEMVSQHHERMDGSGYPRGLVGEEIMFEARMLAVADVVEAMSSHRTYRPALSMDQALDEIVTHRDSLYDSRVVDACVAVVSGGFEFVDEL